MGMTRWLIYPVLFVAALALATRGFTAFGADGLMFPLLITLTFFTLIFIIAQIVKDNSIVDMVWGMGFVIGSLSTLAFTEEPTVLSYVIVGFILVWGLRLSGRLIRRNWGRPEDFRYAQWRKEWGDKVVVTAFFKVFMLQGLINFAVGSASYAIIRFNTFEFGGWSTLAVVGGLFIAFTGLFFEVVGDEQLRRHIRKGDKTLMTSGLWKLTRHPNYFGEILIWSGLYLTGFSMIGTDIGFVFYGILVVSPLIMATVLIKVSTPLLEKSMAGYPGWDDYVERTPMLFPWGRRGTAAKR